MEHYKVVEGIKIFERKCKCCQNTFLVPESCPQLFCSEFCSKNGKFEFKRGKKKKKLSYKLKRSDYEKS